MKRWKELWEKIEQTQCKICEEVDDSHDEVEVDEVCDDEVEVDDDSLEDNI